MKFTPANDDGFPDHASALSRCCDRCGEGMLRRTRVQTAFWRDERLVVVRGIPALVCDACGEEYVSARTAKGIDRLWAERAEAEVVDQMIVPVFAFYPADDEVRR